MLVVSFPFFFLLGSNNVQNSWEKNLSHSHLFQTLPKPNTSSSAGESKRLKGNEQLPKISLKSVCLNKMITLKSHNRLKFI